MDDGSPITQPLPPGNGEAVLPYLLADIQRTFGELPVRSLLQQAFQERTKLGSAIYGTALRTHNGRDALVDAYQELLDACQYLRQVLLEQPLTWESLGKVSLLYQDLLAHVGWLCWQLHRR